jgi:glycosyltransferase involved in cell wall biosynthesis
LGKAFKQARRADRSGNKSQPNPLSHILKCKEMNTTKILHVIPSFGLGGMEKVICSIINQTCHQYQHSILSLDGNTSAYQWIKVDGIQKIEFFKHREFSLFLKQLYRVIKILSPDLLMTYNWGATDSIWVGKLAGVKNIIHNEHGFSIEEAKLTAWKRDMCRFAVYRMVSVLVTVSSSLRLSLRKKYWLTDQKVRTIHNGTDSNHYSPNLDVRRRMRRELNFSEEDLVIVFSGRLDPVKNFEFLLKVFEYCRKVDKTIKLLIVGDGPERQRIEQLSIQKNLHAAMVMVGQKFEVLPYLRAGDVFLLTSITEQMPLTILEAMSVGLPVIASNVGEIRNIIDDNQNGFLRNISDGYEGFVSALLSLNDPSNRQTMSQAARAKIVTGFQESSMVQGYQTLIDNILGQYRQ